jgi:hypothetical protein
VDDNTTNRKVLANTVMQWAWFPQHLTHLKQL